MTTDASMYQIFIVVEAPCLGSSSKAISAFDVNIDIYEYVTQLKKYEHNVRIYPVANYFGLTLNRIIKLARALNIDDFKSDFYLITPLGLLTDKDFIFPYKECFETMPRNDLYALFDMKRIKEKIYDLLESDFALGIFCISHKVASVLNIDYYAPINKPIIVVADSYNSPKKNIFVITARHAISAFFQKKEKLSLCEGVLDYIQKILSIETFRKNVFQKLLPTPTLLLEELFNMRNLRHILKRKRARQVDIRKFLRQRG